MADNNAILTELKIAQKLLMERYGLFTSQFVANLPALFDVLNQSGVVAQLGKDVEFTCLGQHLRFNLKPDIHDNVYWRIMLERKDGTDAQGKDNWVVLEQLYSDNLGNLRKTKDSGEPAMLHLREALRIGLVWLGIAAATPLATG
jgi:hypothetical protein